MENKKKDDSATLTAQAHNVTASYVRLVVNGKRNNDNILSTYNAIVEAKEQFSKPVELHEEAIN